MANRPVQVVPDYEVLFALRTGVTILMPQQAVLDQADKTAPLYFRASVSDIVIEAQGGSAVLQKIQKDYLAEAVERGFIMLYETKDDEVVRCTSCRYRA